jgi:hypothetical protein
MRRSPSLAALQARYDGPIPAALRSAARRGERARGVEIHRVLAAEDGALSLWVDRDGVSLRLGDDGLRLSHSDFRRIVEEVAAWQRATAVAGEPAGPPASFP